jgi:hypothetical protein
MEEEQVSEKQTVYVIATGDDNEFEIHGVYSTPEKAQAAMDERPDLGNGSRGWIGVQEFVLDESTLGDTLELRMVHRAEIRLESGRVESKSKLECYPKDRSHDDASWIYNEHEMDARFGRMFAEAHSRSEVSLERAVELATKAREQWLAKQGKE